MHLIEGLCYLNPHHAELVASNPVMRGVWRKCASLVKEREAIMAPLFVDDRVQIGGLCQQSVNELLQATTGKTYESFPWLGSQISETALQATFGTSSCVQLDVQYHLQVLSSLSIMDPDWKWTVVHPLDFQTQQAEMLNELWKRLASTIDIGAMAGRCQTSKDDLQGRLRDSLLKRFTHHWVGDDGFVSMTTHPIFSKKKVVHESVAVLVEA